MAIPQLTVRGLDDDIADRLRQHAEQSGQSLSQAALDLLRRGAGLTAKPAPATRIGHSLDPWFGTWEADESQAFTDAVADFSRLDPELWK